MQFPGYWVFFQSGNAVLERTTFDETDLDPATGWKQAWQNEDSAASPQGFVELTAALQCAAQALASISGHSLGQSEADQLARFEPKWIDDRCEFQSLAHLLIVN